MDKYVGDILRVVYSKTVRVLEIYWTVLSQIPKSLPLIQQGLGQTIVSFSIPVFVFVIFEGRGSSSLPSITIHRTQAQNKRTTPTLPGNFISKSFIGKQREWILYKM